MSVSPPGLQLRTHHRVLRSAVELLSSMRFAISLLVVLAIASIIGTVLTQGDPYPNYVNQFGPFWADIFRALGLYTVGAIIYAIRTREYGAIPFLVLFAFGYLLIGFYSVRHQFLARTIRRTSVDAGAGALEQVPSRPAA